MGAICSKQHNKQNNYQQQNDFQIILHQVNPKSEPVEEELKDKKHNKIDAAQNSIDLNKKRYSSKDMSIISKYIENELKNQSVKLERLTIDMRDPSMSVKGTQIVQRKDISQEQEEEDESYVCNTIYTNPNYKCLRSMNEQTMSLLFLNENKSTQELLHRVVNDYHFSIKFQAEFSEILMRSQDSFLQNLIITEKYINEYGIFHIVRESIKYSKIDLILQNDFTLNFTKLHYNKLFVGISHLPVILATQHIPLFLLEFREVQTTYKQLTQSNFELLHFINQIKFILEQENILQFLSLSEQNGNIVVALLISNLTTSSIQMLDKIKKSFHQKLGFFTCKIQPLVKHIGCDLSDIDPWNNREFKEETKADSQFSLQFGWKLFALNMQKQNISNIGFIYYNPNQSYIENVRIYSFSDLNRQSSQMFETVEVKVYGEKKYYKILFQITYNDDDIVIIQKNPHLTTLLNSRLTGVMIYDAEKQISKY